MGFKATNSQRSAVAFICRSSFSAISRYGHRSCPYFHLCERLICRLVRDSLRTSRWLPRNFQRRWSLFELWHRLVPIYQYPLQLLDSHSSLRFVVNPTYDFSLVAIIDCQCCQLQACPLLDHEPLPTFTGMKVIHPWLFYQAVFASTLEHVSLPMPALAFPSPVPFILSHLDYSFDFYSLSKTFNSSWSHNSPQQAFSRVHTPIASI